MSLKVGLLSRMKRFISRGATFRAVVLVLSGALAFFALSLANSAVRSSYGGIAHRHVVQPLRKLAEKTTEARRAAKQLALDEREAARKRAVRNAARQAGSMSSPYVEVGEDALFPLLVRVWLNVAPSHTARVVNNDERFPLVYERAVSAEGFVPVVGLAFGDNNPTLSDIVIAPISPRPSLSSRSSAGES